jgi:hypothetical protein
MQQTISQLYQFLIRLFLFGLLIQFYLASAPLFGVGLSFAPHRILGAGLTALAILFPLLAFAARMERKQIGLSLLLLVLTIVQGLLPSLRAYIPVIAALHPLNALALMGLSGMIRRSFRAEAPQVLGSEQAQAS